MNREKEKARKIRFLGSIAGIFILIAVGVGLIAASLFFLPLLFLIPILLPLWMLFWHAKGKRKKDARGGKVTLVDKSRYTVIEQDEDESSSRNESEGKDF